MAQREEKKKQQKDNRGTQDVLFHLESLTLRSLGVLLPAVCQARATHKSV
jgi:hypothetical protein